MSYHKKQNKKQKKERKEQKKHDEHKRFDYDCNCEQKYFFPLPNIPSQPVGGSRVSPEAWLAPGSVQACCSIYSTVRPVYNNPYNLCRNNRDVYPINNTAYYTSSLYGF